MTNAGKLAAEVAAREYDGPSPDLIIVSPFSALGRRLPRFASAGVEEWPVHEFTYLSPKLVGTSNQEERLPMVEAYWETATADTNHGEGAESVRDFITRVQTALVSLHNRPEGTILVVCHEFVIKAGMWLGTQTPDFRSANTPQRFREYSLSFRVSNLEMRTYPFDETPTDPRLEKA